MIEKNDELDDLIANPEEEVAPPKKKKRWKFYAIALGLLLAVVVGVVWMLIGSDVKVDRKGNQGARELGAAKIEGQDAEAQKNGSADRIASLYSVPATDGNGKMLGASPAPSVSPSPGTLGTIPAGQGDAAWQPPPNVKPSPSPGVSPTPVAANNAVAKQSAFFGGQGAQVKPASVPSKARSYVFGEEKKAELPTALPSPSVQLPLSELPVPKKKPILGTMLPVMVLGAVYTHGLDNLVRLRLNRDIAGEGWAFKKGTLFVGKVKGGFGDRAFVDVIGYLDTDGTPQLVKLEGQVMGSDGGSGLKGEKKRVVPIMGRVLDRLLGAGTQIASSALNRGGSPIIIQQSDFSQYQQSESGQRFFVEVPAGAQAFIMVSEIPGSNISGNVLATAEQQQMSGTEFAEMVAAGNIETLRRNLPRMSPDMRNAVESVLRESGNAIRP